MHHAESLIAHETRASDKQPGQQGAANTVNATHASDRSNTSISMDRGTNQMFVSRDDVNEDGVNT